MVAAPIWAYKGFRNLALLSIVALCTFILEPVP